MLLTSFASFHCRRLLTLSVFVHFNAQFSSVQSILFCYYFFLVFIYFFLSVQFSVVFPMQFCVAVVAVVVFGWFCQLVGLLKVVQQFLESTFRSCFVAFVVVVAVAKT